MLLSIGRTRTLVMTVTRYSHVWTLLSPF
ncbi:hypothetical protein HDF16_000733 [Granulicella aggregans]|uniref:Uncharacterized protein n=1 Tax=Granulicella aggregans TaxID=474949 RepID=A0A7W7Z9Y8_9BACT|nr:hypothetical protein [Granulicella aggregans]